MTELVYVAGAVMNTPTGPLPMVANFAYSDSDPLAVSVTFMVDIELDCGAVVTDTQTWAFARDLLDTALSKPDMGVGDGDVRFCYHSRTNHLQILLVDIHDVARPIWVEAEPVMQFMEAAIRAVPAHQEHVDVDTAIERLLEGTWER